MLKDLCFEIQDAVKAKEGGVKNDSEKETIAFHGAWRLFVCTACRGYR